MASIGDILTGALTGLGWPGLLAAIFIIFMVDAAILPTLPELFTIAFYVQYAALGVHPTTWAVALLVSAVVGELCGNGLIYLLFSRVFIKRKKMPRFLEKAINAWADFLIVKNEKAVLVNRFAPAIPFIGAFIAVCKWNVGKSFAYIALGSLVKYSLVLALVGYLNVAYDPAIAQWLTIGAVVVILALSLAARYVQKRRLRKKTLPSEKA